MQFHPVGRSGLITANLTLGTMLFGEDSTRSTPEAEAKIIMDQYLAAGGNHIDTADVYASGRSEEIIGRHLKAKRHQLIYSTKARFPLTDDPNRVGLSRGHLLASVEASLRRLQTDYLAR